MFSYTLNVSYICYAVCASNKLNTAVKILVQYGLQGEKIRDALEEAMKQ